MAQPDFQNLSNLVAATAQELAFVPNVSAINHGGQWLQIQQTLQKIQQAMQQQGQQLVQIHQDMSRLDRNNFARLLNSSVNRSDIRLEVLYGINNQLVQDFPETGTDIEHLLVSILRRRS